MFACEIKEEFDSKMEIEGEFSFQIIFLFFCWYNKINEDNFTTKDSRPWKPYLLTLLIGQL